MSRSLHLHTLDAVNGSDKKASNCRLRYGEGKGVPAHDIKTYAAVEVQLHSFTTSALDGGQWSASHRGRFTQDQNLQYSLKR